MIFVLAMVSVVAFLFGSLPLSRLVTYSLTLNGRFDDPRASALIRVCTDIAKGAVAVRFGHEAGIAGAQLAVLFVYLGHIFPLGAGFGQQNGTGTLLGALAIWDPMIGLTAISSWMFAYYIYRHATFSAMISACLTTLIWSFSAGTSLARVELLVLLTLIVMWRHRRHIHVPI